MNLGKSNYNTEKDQDQCASEIEKYLLKRQARMSLLEQDKIALSLTVPWNPMLHAGKMIDVELPRKGVEGGKNEDKLLYGSGRYLIVNLTHTIKNSLDVFIIPTKKSNFIKRYKNVYKCLYF